METDNRTYSGMTFRINEDGSITRTGFYSDFSKSVNNSKEKPQILKMYLSKDHMECGESVVFYWNIENSCKNELTIAQSGYEDTFEIPDTGELNIESDIISHDISLTIHSENESGAVYARKILSLSKRKNEFNGSIAVTIFYIIVFALILTGIILKIL